LICPNNRKLIFIMKFFLRHSPFDLSLSSWYGPFIIPVELSKMCHFQALKITTRKFPFPRKTVE
jgi:hypothetical protein